MCQKAMNSLVPLTALEVLLQEDPEDIIDVWSTLEDGGLFPGDLSLDADWDRSLDPNLSLGAESDRSLDPDLSLGTKLDRSLDPDLLLCLESILLLILL